MSDYGLKVSQVGYDVETATPSQLAYSSKWSNFKIGRRDTFTIEYPGGTSVGAQYYNSISNPLPYIPMFFAYIEATTTAPGKWQLCSSGAVTGTVAITTDTHGTFPESNTSSSELYAALEMDLGPEVVTYTVKFILFVDDLLGTTQYNFPSTVDYGIKVSKTGKNVNTAYDTELSMSSKFSNLTIFSSGTVSTGAEPIEITHSLGYVPIHLVLVQDPDTSVWRYLPTRVTPSSGGASNSIAYADNTKLYISQTHGTSVNYTFKYLIFNERIV